MKEKVDLKSHKGKSRIYVPVVGSVRVSRLFVWDAIAGEYRAPARGKAYQARRYMNERRETAFFESLANARDWQSKTTSQKTAVRVEENPVEAKAGLLNQSVLLREVIEDWKKRNFARLQNSTQDQYCKLIRLYFEPLVDLPVEQIDSKCVDRWIAYLIEPVNGFLRTENRMSFDHELALLSTILRHYLEYNDDTTYRFPIKRRHREAIVVRRRTTVENRELTEGEFKRFRAALLEGSVGTLMYALATVQFYQALRISEAAALHWEDVVIDAGEPHRSRVQIKRSVEWLRTKGTVARIKAGFKNSASCGGMKEQPMFPESFIALSKLKSDACSNLVFQKNGVVLDYRTIQHAYDTAFEKAKLPYSGTHILRHGGTRRVYNNTPDLEVAKQLLGNSDLKTAQVYAKRSAGALTEVAKGEWLQLAANSESRKTS